MVTTPGVWPAGPVCHEGWPLIGQLLPHYRDHMRGSDRDQAYLVAGDYNHVGLTVKQNANITNLQLGPRRHDEKSVLQSTCHDQVCYVFCVMTP